MPTSDLIPGGGFPRTHWRARHVFLWDGDVIARETVNGRAVDWFFEPRSFRPLARCEGGTLSYVVTDHLGTPKEVLSSGGSLLWSSDHDTWGYLRPIRAASVAGDFWTEAVTETPAETASVTFCPIRFQGQWEDAETGLYQNRFRYYDPAAGQYLSADPIGTAGGVNARLCVVVPSLQFDPLGLRNAVVNNGVLCLVNKFAAGSGLAGEFDAFVGLWDEVTRATPGGLTRRTMTPELTAEANSFRRRAKAELRCCGMGNLAPGHTPDTAWGGAADPGDAWVPLDQDVNQYIGGLTQGVAPGTNYTSVRSVRNLSDC